MRLIVAFLYFFCVTSYFGCGDVCATGMPSAASIPYRPILSGIADIDLRTALMEDLQLFVKKTEYPLTVAALKMRAQEDMKSAVKFFALRGYYDAQVDYSINFSTTPITVNFMVQLGTLYTISAFDIGATTTDNLVLNGLALNSSVLGPGAVIGAPAQIKDIREAIRTIFITLGNNGYPYAVLENEKATVDREKRSVEVSVFINAGKEMRFGEVDYLIAHGMSKKFIEKRLAWKKGDVYSNTKVIQTIENLNNTGTYNYVKITRPPTAPSDGNVTMVIEAAPSNPKNLSYDLNNQGDLGPQADLGWTGVNVFAEGDFLKIKGSIGQPKKGLSVEHLVPDFGWTDAQLSTKAGVFFSKMPSYSSSDVSFMGTFTTPLIEKMKGSAGYQIKMRTITPANNGGTHSPLTAAVPLSVSYEDLDDPRRPRKGWNATLEMLPSMQLSPNRFFFQVSLSQKGFLPLTLDKRLILSGWYRVGMSPGVSPDLLPMDMLYYAGGPGSVRGYGSQMAGPIDAQGNPLGGRALLSFGSEMLYYITGDVAIKGFIDAGTVFDSQYPTLGHRLFVGAGGGITYHSPIGDVLLDVGFPVNRRPQDQKAQIYLSLSNAV